MNFPKTIILIAIIFPIPISLSKFAPISKKVKEIIVIIGGPGTGKSTIIDGFASCFVVTLKFPEKYPRGKETRYRAIISRKAIVIQ
jgi:predicted ATP-binding protein involved in virulence